MQIAVEAYRLVQHFPTSERFELCSQVTRAAVSIPCNIAEGSSRRSEKDYYRFVEISLGSCFELETQTLLAKMIGYINEEETNTFLQKVIDEQRMLSSFMKTLQ